MQQIPNSRQVIYDWWLNWGRSNQITEREGYYLRFDDVGAGKVIQLLID